MEADTHQSLKSLDEIYNIWELLEFLCLFRANLHQEYIYTEHVNKVTHHRGAGIRTQNQVLRLQSGFSYLKSSLKNQVKCTVY